MLDINCMYEAVLSPLAFLRKSPCSTAMKFGILHSKTALTPVLNDNY